MNTIHVSKKLPQSFSSSKEVVLIYCIVEKKLLLLRRNLTSMHPGLWTAPGGKVDAGESLEEAAKRELLEETGISDQPLQSLGKLYVQIPQLEYTLYVYGLKLITVPEVTISSEHIEYDWFDEVQASQLTLIPSGNEVLDYCKNTVERCV